jgi:hypothetical protein
MMNLYGVDVVKQSKGWVACETTARSGSEPLEVNVIFTQQQATAAALKSAESLARGLEASIRLRAAIVVPLRLPLDQPPVSVPFMERLLGDLVGQPEPGGPELSVHLYVCRDWIEMLLQVLRPNSLVVIGGRKHWWPTAASRMARALRGIGHRVVFVDIREQRTGSVR